MKNKMFISLLGAALLLTACSKNEIPPTQMKPNHSASANIKENTANITKENEKHRMEDQSKSNEMNHSEKKADKTPSLHRNSEESEKKQNDQISSGTSKHKKLSVLDAKVKAAEAFESYQQLYPNSKLDSFALKEKDHQLVYVLEGYDAKSEYDVILDANSKDILKQEQDTLGQKQGKEITKEDLSQIDTFLKKALSDAGEGYVPTEYEIDYNDGIKVVTIHVEAPQKEDIKYVFNHQTQQLLERDM